MRFVSIKAATLVSVLTLLGPASADQERTVGTIRMLVQSSPLAGSQYHQLNDLQKAIRVGDTLDLIREPDNPYDRNAVSVHWRGKMLGFLPKKENRAVAQAMDQGETLKATVAFMAPDPNPWKRLRISVFVEL